MSMMIQSSHFQNFRYLLLAQVLYPIFTVTMDDDLTLKILYYLFLSVAFTSLCQRIEV